MRSTRKSPAKSKSKSRRPSKQPKKAKKPARRISGSPPLTSSPGNKPSAVPTEMHIETPASAKAVEIFPQGTRSQKKPRR
jgi:hypothetical protein